MCNTEDCLVEITSPLYLSVLSYSHQNPFSLDPSTSETGMALSLFALEDVVKVSSAHGPNPILGRGDAWDHGRYVPHQLHCSQASDGNGWLVRA